MSRLPAKRINIGLEWCTVNSAVTASRDGTYLVYATTDNPYDRNDNKINHTFTNLIESSYKYDTYDTYDKWYERDRRSTSEIRELYDQGSN